jgi:hypothetical protein
MFECLLSQKNQEFPERTGGLQPIGRGYAQSLFSKFLGRRFTGFVSGELISYGS